MALTVLFVCPHGAGKSRMAAAWFNGAQPAGWWATSAGVAPQASVSEHAARLLAGTPVASALDGALPRPVSAVPDASLSVAIDCQPGAVPGAVSWRLEHQDFDEAMCEEIRVRVRRLLDTLVDRTGAGR